MFLRRYRGFSLIELLITMLFLLILLLSFFNLYIVTNKLNKEKIDRAFLFWTILIDVPIIKGPRVLERNYQ
jgi:prepilin-type N-terminal cleavage/methylation domain-containing protein